MMHDGPFALDIRRFRLILGPFRERKPMKTKTEAAVEKFLAGYNCAQAVLYSFCDDLRFDKDLALKLASGFGAGMARKQGTCGAIAGGIIAIGLKYGRGEGQDRAATEETYRKVQELLWQFESRHGTSICRTLLMGCNLNTAEGQRYFKENDLLNKTCKGCVTTVGETLEKIL
jgi:C_GCAxxG_C_C family probable redox protein